MNQNIQKSVQKLLDLNLCDLFVMFSACFGVFFSFLVLLLLLKSVIFEVFKVTVIP